MRQVGICQPHYWRNLVLGSGVGWLIVDAGGFEIREIKAEGWIRIG
jgi:hypothetical protein